MQLHRLGTSHVSPARIFLVYYGVIYVRYQRVAFTYIIPRSRALPPRYDLTGSNTDAYRSWTRTDGCSVRYARKPSLRNHWSNFRRPKILDRHRACFTCLRGWSDHRNFGDWFVVLEYDSQFTRYVLAVFKNLRKHRLYRVSSPLSIACKTTLTISLVTICALLQNPSLYTWCARHPGPHVFHI
jgi:hypothetical protein